MKTLETERRDEEVAPPVKEQPSKGGMRLVSRPDQKVLREWEITLPDELVAVLNLNI